ncbi:hypothetical protein I302_101352 [Kwoniella bestiolae CBS 10118]|uniref:Uncharacterized protein n=1 Tax=Kwoniella bestiolae CBS 10118 TaxID=1296100 RepID=A0A1B9GC09_9TREE|nr:hypothetical protein I302_00035 [Kwoniella bestiolae CBS 10118]OCF28547.1 hypothetical protein I302_00035 [Kwoniella bestiolae CBS 10118]
MNMQPSAGERVWAIPELQDAIISGVSPEIWSKLSLVSKSFFEPMIRRIFKSCTQRKYEELMRRCRSNERKALYRSSIEIIILHTSNLSARPANWVKLFEHCPNLEQIIYQSKRLKRSINDDGKPEYTFDYSCHECLPWNPTEPIKAPVGLPKSFKIVRNLTISAGLDWTVQESLYPLYKSKLLERIRFYGHGPSSLNLLYLPLPTHYLVDMFSELVKERFDTPKVLSLKTFDLTLPELVNLIGNKLEVFSVEPETYATTGIAFEEFYRKVEWDQLQELFTLLIAFRRQPTSESDLQNNVEDTPFTIPIRKDVKKLKNLYQIRIELVYPPDTILSPIQLDNEKRYVRQIADIVYSLVHWSHFITKEPLSNNLVLMASYERTDMIVPHVRSAEFSHTLYQAFLERIKERGEADIRRLEGTM